MTNNNVPYVALTALSKFWPLEGDIVFLGDWCDPTGELRKDSNIIDVIKHPFSDLNYYYDFYNSKHKLLIDKASLFLSPLLNEIHHETLSDKEWTVFLYPWLYIFIFVLYDRYLSVKALQKTYKQYKVSQFVDIKIIAPNNVFDAMSLYYDDTYNQWLFMIILNKIAPSYIQRSDDLVQSLDLEIPKPVQTGSSFIKQFKKSCHYILSFSLHFFSKFQKNIIAYKLHFSAYDRLRIAFKSFFKITPFINLDYTLDQRSVNYKMRDQIRCQSYDSEDEFEQLLLAVLPDMLPTFVIENYDSVKKKSEKLYKKNCNVQKLIGSTDLWGNPVLVYCVMKYFNKGNNIYKIQHGGNYGSVQGMRLEEISFSLGYTFVTWGWTLPQKKVLPLFFHKIQNRVKLAKKSSILWCATSIPRYCFRPHSLLPYQWQFYREAQQVFYDHINEDTMKKIFFREYFNDYGRQLSTQLSLSCPNMMLVSASDSSFVEALNSCKIYIGDHLSTTFLQALACNVPCILFWNDSYEVVRDDAIKNYKLLEEVSILFKDPKQAAEHLNLVYDDIDAWWLSDATQKGVQQFVATYARQPDNYIDEFCRFLT
jgi:putative transferase (TIGR04331 family)